MNCIPKLSSKYMNILINELNKELDEGLDSWNQLLAEMKLIYVNHLITNQQSSSVTRTLTSSKARSAHSSSFFRARSSFMSSSFREDNRVDSKTSKVCKLSIMEAAQNLKSKTNRILFETNNAESNTYGKSRSNKLSLDKTLLNIYSENPAQDLIDNTFLTSLYDEARNERKREINQRVDTHNPASDMNNDMPNSAQSITELSALKSEGGVDSGELVAHSTESQEAHEIAADFSKSKETVSSRRLPRRNVRRDCNSVSSDSQNNEVSIASCPLCNESIEGAGFHNLELNMSSHVDRCARRSQRNKSTESIVVLNVNNRITRSKSQELMMVDGNENIRNKRNVKVNAASRMHYVDVEAEFDDDQDDDRLMDEDGNGNENEYEGSIDEANRFNSMGSSRSIGTSKIGDKEEDIDHDDDDDDDDMLSGKVQEQMMHVKDDWDTMAYISRLKQFWIDNLSYFQHSPHPRPLPRVNGTMDIMRPDPNEIQIKQEKVELVHEYSSNTRNSPINCNRSGSSESVRAVSLSRVEDAFDPSDTVEVDREDVKSWGPMEMCTQIRDVNTSWCDSGFDSKAPLTTWNDLYDYQKEGCKWMMGLYQSGSGGILGDEMGLGKTAQLCTHFASLSETRRFHAIFLIVCPSTVLQHWCSEMHRWAPNLRTCILHEVSKRGQFIAKKSEKFIETSLLRLLNDDASNGVAIITSYEMLRKHFKALQLIEWTGIALDEGQKIRNHKSEISKVCKDLPSYHRIILSGTPIQNNLKELWSLFDFIFPGRLGSLSIFETEFETPIRMGGYANATKLQAEIAMQTALMLQRIVRPFLLRRKKEDISIMAALPKKTEQILFCKLSPNQRTIYNSVLSSPEVKAVLQKRISAFRAINVLRKLCNHPVMAFRTGRIVWDSNDGKKMNKRRKLNENASIDHSEDNCPEGNLDNNWANNFISSFGIHDSDDDSDSFDKMDVLNDLEKISWADSGKLLVLSKLLPLWFNEKHKVLLFTQTQTQTMLNLIEKMVKEFNFSYMRLDGSTPASKRHSIVCSKSRSHLFGYSRLANNNTSNVCACSYWLFYYGDSFETPYGRRKPLIFAGVIIQVASVIIQSMPPSYTQSELFLWYLIFHITFTCAGWLQSIPLNSWIIESSANNDDYIRIRTLPFNLGTLGGALCGLATGYFADPRIGASIYAVGVCITLFLLLKYVPNKTLRLTEKQPDLIPSFRSCMKTKEFQTIFYNRILIISALGIGFSNGVFLLIVGFGIISRYKQIVQFLIVLLCVFFIVGALATMSLNWVLKYYDKLYVYKILTLAVAFIGVLVFPSTIWDPLLSFYTTCALLVIAAIISVPIIAIDGFFLKDLVVYDTFLTGLNRENMYQTAMTIPTGLAEGVITSIPAIILYATGFVSGTNKATDDQIISKFLWTEDSLWILRIWGSFAITVIALLSYLLIRNYPLNDKVANQINEAVKSQGIARSTNRLSHISGMHENQQINLLVPDSKEGHSRPSSFVFNAKRLRHKHRDVLAENEELMFMMNFSESEIKSMLSNVEATISELKRAIILGLALASGAIILLTLAVAAQIKRQLETYIILFITLVLLTSLYLLYDFLRYLAIDRLLSYPVEKQLELLRSANESNETRYTKLQEDFQALGIEDTGAQKYNDSRQSMMHENENGNEHENESGNHSVFSYIFRASHIKEVSIGGSEAIMNKPSVSLVRVSSMNSINSGGNVNGHGHGHGHGNKLDNHESSTMTTEMVIEKGQKMEKSDEFSPSISKGKARANVPKLLEREASEEKLPLPGYVRIYAIFSSLIVLGVMGFTRLLVDPVNPPGHHPTMSPTPVPETASLRGY